MVAARVKGPEDEENWILAEVVVYNTAAGKYDVDDIDAEEGKEYDWFCIIFILTVFKFFINFVLWMKYVTSQANCCLHHLLIFMTINKAYWMLNLCA